MTSPWLTVPEACKYIRMESKTSPIHFTHMCRAGRVKAKKIGKQWLTKVEWLDQMDENPRRGK